MTRFQQLCFILLGLMLTGSFVSAQNYEGLAPKEPPQRPPANFLPSQPSEGTISEPVHLKGIILLADPSKIVDDILEKPEGLEIQGLDYLKSSDLQKMLETYLSAPIASQTIEILLRDILLFSHLHGHPTACAVIPKQNPAKGVLQIVIIEKPVGKVEPVSNANLDSFNLFQSIAKSTAPRTRLEDFYWIHPSITESLSDPEDKILVQKLEGIIFMSSVDQVRANGISGVHGVRAFSFGILRTPEYYSKIRSHFGEPVTLKIIKQITRETILHFRANDHPVVDVFVPEQDITTGVLQVVVQEGRLGQVRSEGTQWFSPSRISKAIRLKPEEYISEETLTQDLNWSNANPFRQTTAAFTPGKTPGYTDLVLKTQDRLPVRFFGGYDDSGNDLTGDERVTMGMNWGDALFLDHQMSYQFTADLDFEKIMAHSGSYMIPLPWRHRLTFFGSYAETKADLSGTFFDLVGSSWQASTRYGFSLPTLKTYRQEFTVGFDFKQSNNNLEFGGSQVFNTVTEINQFVLDYASNIQDSLGITTFNITGTFSPGDLSGRNTEPLFVASRASSKPEYMYGKFAVERLTRLPQDFSLNVKAGAQISTDNLLGSEQFGLGGYTLLRGYDEREANGDEGYYLSTEIRTPPFHLNDILDREDKLDQLQFLSFFDYGATQNRFLLSGEDPHIQMASAGLGMRYSVSTWLSMRFDYGWQFFPTGINLRDNARAHLGMVVSY